jgi:glycosyltransferase involved in cell wall biosynthesis
LVVGGWEAPFYIRTIILAKRKRIPIIQFYESTLDSHRFNNLLIRKIRSSILSQADFIVTAGSASTKAVTAMGIAPEKIITLFNPVDVSWFYAFAKDHRVLTTTGHRFIYVGQLIERKNVATVIRSFAEIKKDGDILTIAGDGPLSQELKKLAATLGISDSVNFVGHKNQEELAALYATSNTLILASINEVWGLVVNEALASGLHVVVSDKCGVAEFVKDMSGAYICSTNQQSIKAMLIKSRDEWNGYVPEPEILKFTPEKFAEGVMLVIDLANKHFTSLKSYQRPIKQAASYTGGSYMQSRDLEQVHLVLGFEGVSYLSSDLYAIQILSILLGGGMSSRLFQEVREKRGLAYTVYSFNSTFLDSNLGFTVKLCVKS